MYLILLSIQKNRDYELPRQNLLFPGQGLPFQVATLISNFLWILLRVFVLFLR